MSKLLYEAKVGERTIFNLFQRDNGYFVVERPSPNIVSLISITDEGNLILVKQYREGINNFCVELPSGLDDKDKPLEQTALEELEEETGYTSSNIHLAMTLPKSPGMTNETQWIFWADSPKKVSAGGGVKDEGEDIEVIEVPIKNLYENLLALLKEVPIANSVFSAAFLIQNRNGGQGC